MLKSIARDILKVKIFNALVSSLFSIIGQQKLSYRVRLIADRMPDFVEIALPRTHFTLNKLNFYCAKGKDQMSRAAAAFGWHAPETPMPMLLQSLMTPDGVFFDIGANSGYYSIIALASKNRPAAIHSFEPSKDALTFFKKNLEINNLPSNGFAIQEVALSDRTGSAELYYPVDTHNLLETSQTLVKHHKGRMEYEKTDLVEVTTLDSFVENQGINRIDLVKIDVEGHEEAVFSGAAKALQTLRPIIFFEVLQDMEMNNILGELRSNDYLIFQMNKTSVVQTDNIVFSKENRNQIAVPSEKKEFFVRTCVEAGLAA